MIFALILSGLVVVFIAQNAQVAELQFLMWSLVVSQALLLILVLAVGVLTGWVLHAWFSHRRRQRRALAEAAGKVRGV